MAVEVVCPGCAAKFKAPDEMIGKKGKCKKCGTAFRVTSDCPPPAPAVPVPAAPAVATPAAEANPFAFGGAAEPTAPEAGAFDFGGPAQPHTPPKKAAPKSGPVKAEAAAEPTKPARPAKPQPAPAKVEPAPVEAEESAPIAAAADDLDVPAAMSLDDDASPEPTDVRKGHAASKARRRDDADGTRRAAGSGRGKLLLLAGVGVLVIGGVVTFAMLLFNQKSDDKVAKGGTPTDNKNDTPAPPADPDANKTEPPALGAKGGNDGKNEPPAKTPPDKTPPTTPKEPPKKDGPPPKVLADAKPIDLKPLAAKPMAFQKPAGNPLGLAAPFPVVRRVFPPPQPNADPVVLWQTSRGFQGDGEKLALGVFSPQTGATVNVLDVYGDSKPEPVCDLLGNLFAQAIRGKVTVWDVKKKERVVDGFDPYAEFPDHKRAGLAAVYLTEPPDRFVTVSTAGAVHVWEVAEKKLVGEYAPPTATPETVVAAKNVAAGPNRQSVVVATGGTVYRVSTKAPIGGEVVAELGGDGRPLGLAASAAGVVYVFEAGAGGKKERAVTLLLPGVPPQTFRWPDAAGEPTGARWYDDPFVGVTTNTGAVFWFELHDKSFRPLALVRTPGNNGHHAAADDHWALMPLAGDPKRSVLVRYGMPPDGLISPTDDAKRPAVTLLLDDKGLQK